MANSIADPGEKLAHQITTAQLIAVILNVLDISLPMGNEIV